MALYKIVKNVEAADITDALKKEKKARIVYIHEVELQPIEEDNRMGF